MSTPLAALPFAVLLVSTGSSSAPESLALALEPDAVLRVQLRFSNEQNSVSGRATMDGEVEEMPDEVSFELSETVSILAEDRYPGGAVDANAEVIRSFEALERSATVEMQEGERGEKVEIEVEGDLLDESVRFTIRDGERICLPADEGDDLDADLLESLRADFGAWCLLPEEEVEEGDSWDLEGEALRPLLLPGGLHALQVSDRDQVETDDPGTEAFEVSSILGPFGLQNALDEVEGTVTATLSGAEEGKAEVTFEGELRCSGDLTELVVETLENVDVSDSLEVVEHRMDYELQLEGTLVWDIKTGCLDSLEWSGDSQATFTITSTRELGGESFGMTLELDVEGSSTLELSIVE